MTHFSTSWKSSRKPGKQRKYRINSPIHVRQNFTHAHLSKDLRKKHGKRNTSIRKGDKVRILRGQFRKQEGKVERIDVKKTKVYISGIELAKKDGTKKQLALHPSNLMITELNMDDKQRQKSIERK